MRDPERDKRAKEARTSGGVDRSSLTPPLKAAELLHAQRASMGAPS